ncbi:MAG: signal peptidase II [Ruminococcus sp.]|nr:signal peptidase II [Ruminococcus sp.]
MIFLALAIGLFIAAADQVIKYFISTNLKPVGSVTVIDNILDFTYVENRGVAFGMFSGMRWIFIVLTALLICAIVIYMFKKKPQSKLFYVCVALIVGGGIGNLIDRIFYGYVIDYISLSFFQPVCNFADYCITVGTFLLVIYVLFFAKGFNEQKKVKASGDE